jgi:hypothetical protein
MSIFGSTFSFPTAIRIASKTISMDLVDVKPLGSNITNQMINEVTSINRERKIDSIVNNTPFEKMQIKDHPDYKIDSPKGNLFYLDYQYGTQSK